MVATIAVITAITVKKKKKKGSEIAARIAATMIAEIEKVPSQRFFFFSDRSDRSDDMETRLYCDKSMKRFAAS